MSRVELNRPPATSSETSTQAFDASDLLETFARFEGVPPQAKEALRQLLSQLRPTPSREMGPEFRKLKRSLKFALDYPFGGADWHMHTLLMRCLTTDERWARAEIARGEMREYSLEVTCDGDATGPTVLYVHFVARGAASGLFLSHAVRRDSSGTYYFAHHRDGLAEAL